MAKYYLIFVLIINLNYCYSDTFDSAKPIKLPTLKTSDVDYILDNDPDALAFKKIQESLFKAISNSSVAKNVKNFEDLLQIFDSDSGREIGKLVFQGFIVGMTHKDPDKVFGQFWNKLQDQISPEFALTINDYKDFFGGMDLYSVYTTWSKIFEKDELGNSLAQIPLGQLIDLVQPSASKYGVDMRAVIDGILGNNGSKFPELVSEFMDNFDLSSIMKLVTDAFVNNNQRQPTKSNEIKPKTEKKRNNNLATLKLFKPLFANILRNNDIDLDVDAVFEVLEPIMGSSQDLVGAVLPQVMSYFGNEGNGGSSILAELLPLITQFNKKPSKPNIEKEAFTKHKEKLEHPSKPVKSVKEKHIEDKDKRTQPSMPDLSGIASLLGNLGGGDNNGLNTMALLGLASQFMSSNSNGKKPKKFKSPTKEKDVEENGITFSNLAQMAVNLIAKDGDSSNVLMKAAEQLVLSMDPKKQQQKDKEIVKEKESKNIEKKQTKKESKKYLVDVLEPVLSSLQSDKKCHVKIKSLFEFGKSVLSKKSVGIDDLKNLLSPIISEHLSGTDEFAQKMLSFSKSEWLDFAKNMENSDFLNMTVKVIVKYLTDIVKLLSENTVREKMYLMVMPNIDAVLQSWGFNGLTIENFPARLGPVIGLMTRTWDLPFNPVTLLVPLKNELVYVQDFISSNLGYIEHMPKDQLSSHLEGYVKDALLGLSDFSSLVDDRPCLPQTLCQLQLADRSATRLYAARFISVIWNFSEAFEGVNDVSYTLQVTKAVLNDRDCKKSFPGECPSTSTAPSSSKDDKHDHVHTDL